MPDSYVLEAQERNVGTPADPSSCASSGDRADPGVSFRHSGWQPNRAKIRDALERVGVAYSRLEAWDDCGRNAWVLRAKTDEGRLKIASATCKDRFCVPCADTRSARIGNRVRAQVPAEGISFLTLTLADNDLSLTELLDKLIASFRALRRWKRWVEAVAGGVAFIETKWNAKLQRWHPHIHAVMEAGFLPHGEISAEWRRITGTSFIVHIKRPRNAETVIGYVTKYGSKPLDQTFVNDAERLDEAIDAMKGRHLCLAFGAWRGWALSDDDEREEWTPIDTLASLLRREARGDPEAVSIMEQLRCTTTRAILVPTKSRAPPSVPTLEEISLANSRAIASTAVSNCQTSLGKSWREPPSVQLALMNVK